MIDPSLICCKSEPRFGRTLLSGPSFFYFGNSINPSFFQTRKLVLLRLQFALPTAPTSAPYHPHSPAKRIGDCARSVSPNHLRKTCSRRANPSSNSCCTSVVYSVIAPSYLFYPMEKRILRTLPPNDGIPHNYRKYVQMLHRNIFQSSSSSLPSFLAFTESLIRQKWSLTRSTSCDLFVDIIMGSIFLTFIHL